MRNVELAIRDFMLLKGVIPFWIDAHLNIIRRGIATNEYFPTHVVEQKVTVKQGHASTYTATIAVIRPGHAHSLISIKYTFRPAHTKAHKVYVTGL